MSSITETEAPADSFQALNLSSSFLAALDRVSYFEPTPIQAAFIPAALSGKDVIGQAQTGTGKTCAFLAPFMSHFEECKGPGPHALVLAPTRELVVQVAEEARKLSPSKSFRSLAIYGGQRMRSQLIELERGPNLVVGTPGRLLDHLSRGSLKLNFARYVVLDEADRMLDIGFRPDIERILRRCPHERQTLLLSATMSGPVLRLAQRYMQDPLNINLSPEKITVENIRQTYFTVDEEQKFKLLVEVIKREKPRQCIIFSERKRWAERLYRDLHKHSRRVAVMHGDLPQPQRMRIMEGFRAGKIACLVATDVVGRGIDVQNISHIINYDLPEDPENYVHRIGRTGRMGSDGVAIAFVTPEQGDQLTNIEAYINTQIAEDKIGDRLYYTPRDVRQAEKEAEPPRTIQPVFGRRVRKYSNRL